MSIDENVKNVSQTRPGAEAAVIWTSEGFPVDNDGSGDGSARNIGIATLANGTVFRGGELRRPVAMTNLFCLSSTLVATAKAFVGATHPIQNSADNVL